MEWIYGNSLTRNDRLNGYNIIYSNIIINIYLTISIYYILIISIIFKLPLDFQYSFKVFFYSYISVYRLKISGNLLSSKYVAKITGIWPSHSG